MGARDAVRRALAILGAVAMVGIALVVRQAIDDDGRGDEGRGGERPVVVCASDLAAACESLRGVEVRVEQAATTAAALEAGAAGEISAWLTTSAWVEVVESREPTALGAAALVARTTAVAAVDPLRADAVRALCGEEVWRCLGDHAEQEWADLGGDARWGPLRTGLPDADRAVGLAVLGAVTAGRFGGTDFAANDFDASNLASWLGGMAAASGGRDPDPAGTLVTRRGQYTAAATTAARVGALDPGRVAILDALPPIDVDVVLAPVGADDLPGPVPDAASDAQAALEALGWDAVDGAAPARYKPGVLAALHTLWTEVT